jgi:spermidine/putrescine transport system substrate-binding protein
MISRMAQNGMLEKLNYDNIPNFGKYVDDSFKSPDYDANQEYSVPYTWGTVGLIYNTKYITEEVDSWEILWDEQYSGKILMFSNSRDAFAIALKRLGYSMNTEDPDELREAAELLMEQKDVVQAYVMDQIFDKMTEENAWVAPYYAGDYITMSETNEDLAFVFPKEGFNQFVDAMCIPKGCVNKEAAEMFINFMCEPRVSAENCGYIGYSTPISAAKDLMDEEVVSNEIAYPSTEILANSETFRNLSDETNKLLDDLWIEVRIGTITAGFWITVACLALGVIALCALSIYRKQKRLRARNAVK